MDPPPLGISGGAPFRISGSAPETQLYTTPAQFFFISINTYTKHITNAVRRGPTGGVGVYPRPPRPHRFEAPAIFLEHEFSGPPKLRWAKGHR